MGVADVWDAALGYGRTVASRVGGLLGVVTPPLVQRRTGADTEAGTAAGETPQQRASAAKYDLGLAVSGPGRRSDAGELPQGYGRDRLVLLSRDPWSLFAYWEITPETRRDALRELGDDAADTREVLRLHDVTFITFTGDNAWLSLDVELAPGAARGYLRTTRPAASFCAEIGLRTAAGRFVPLVRSNTVTTPRATPSTDHTVRWAEVEVPRPSHALDPVPGSAPPAPYGAPPPPR